MSGKRLAGPRPGDRAEYLARYGLSRFSFVYEVPRQEDFGIDFFCTLATEQGESKGKCVYPEESFYIQVKNSRKPIELDSDMLDWMSNHMANPFFICLTDQKCSKLSIYSTTLVWRALSECDKANRITFVFDKGDFLHPENPHISVRDIKNAEYIILLDEPIIDRTLDQLDEDNGVSSYEAMRPHVIADLENAINMRRGRVTTSHVVSGSTINHRWYPRDEKQIAAAEKSLENTLIGLALNYISLEKMDKLQLIAIYLIKRGISLNYLLDLHGKYEPDKAKELEEFIFGIWRENTVLDAFEVDDQMSKRKPDVNETAFAVVMAAIGERPPTLATAPTPPAPDVKLEPKSSKPKKSAPKKPA